MTTSIGAYGIFGEGSFADAAVVAVAERDALPGPIFLSVPTPAGAVAAATVAAADSIADAPAPVAACPATVGTTGVAPPLATCQARKNP